MQQKVNKETIKTLFEMMKEIDEKKEHTDEDAKRRKAIFRSIEIVQAYNNGHIVDGWWKDMVENNNKEQDMKTFRKYHSVEHENDGVILFHQRRNGKEDAIIFKLARTSSDDTIFKIMRAAAKNIIDELNKEEPCHNDGMEAR